MLRILESFACELRKFLKKLAYFLRILLFLYVCKQTFRISHVRTSQKVKGVLTLSAPTPRNGQTQSVCLTILWGWRLKG